MKDLYFRLGCFYLMLNAYVNAINYEKCGSGKHILTVRKLSVSPEPIQLSGKDIRFSIDAELLQDIPAGARMIIKAWKVINIFGMKIFIAAPCISPLGCDIEHCKIFDGFPDDHCPFTRSGSKCGCPIKSQVFRAENIVTPLPSLDKVARWFASGSFWIEVKLVASNSEQLGCYAVSGAAVV
ncbi:ML domain-containing protein [Trichonephila clavata]|uniref:ML domain-containing protein n=1 Tax=Trichonephila clavata TaxID=2740835 RepID=A0A8X6LNB2_TRICU|nr:ML domain-containing protein [Trichonephila clavata]